MGGAYRLNDELSFGLGLDYVTLNAELNNMKTVQIGAGPIQTVDQTLKGDGNGYGYNAAAFYKNDEKWSFGANYRSPVKIDVDGTIALPLTAPYAAAAIDSAAKTSITLPDTFQLGASYKHSDKWLFSAAADYTDWATYHRLIVEYTQGGAAKTSASPKNWQSVWAFRAGTEYKYSDELKFQAGTFYDITPVKEKYFETRVPDSDRVALSIGAGYTKDSLTLNVTYTYLIFTERKIDGSDNGATLNGKYTASAHLPGIGASYKF